MESASLSNLIHLSRLGLRGGVDMRPTLLRVLTDLYVQKLAHTPDEERHYFRVATGPARRLSRLFLLLDGCARRLDPHPARRRDARNRPNNRSNKTKPC